MDADDPTEVMRQCRRVPAEQIGDLAIAARR
jgi:hypothetical protein